jgi:hypothetical protein
VPQSFRNRDRRNARRTAYRDPRPIILIVCEGQNTEPEYFDQFWKACKNPRVKVEPAREHGVPLTLVQVARDKKRAAEMQAEREGDENLAFDQVWCVFDVDNHPHVAEARLLAKEHQIRLAVSNQSFELWLLLHHRSDPGPKHRSDLRKLLKKHVPAYDKHVNYKKDYEPGYADAKRRAKALCHAADIDSEPGRNPTTNVYELTHEIERSDGDVSTYSR